MKQRRKRRQEARIEKEGEGVVNPESALLAEQEEALVVRGGSRTNPCPEDEEIALRCNLAVRWRGGEDVLVEMVPCEGGRDAAHGLLQALKNKHKMKEKNEHPEG